MLGVCYRVLHWFTHSCQREYSQDYTTNVGTGFALAISMPTLAASRVGMSLACVSNKCANVAGLLCWHVLCYSKIHANFGVPLVFDTGEGVDLC